MGLGGGGLGRMACVITTGKGLGIKAQGRGQHNAAQSSQRLCGWSRRETGVRSTQGAGCWLFCQGAWTWTHGRGQGIQGLGWEGAWSTFGLGRSPQNGAGRMGGGR